MPPKWVSVPHLHKVSVPAVDRGCAGIPAAGGLSARIAADRTPKGGDHAVSGPGYSVPQNVTFHHVYASRALSAALAVPDTGTTRPPTAMGWT